MQENFALLLLLFYEYDHKKTFAVSGSMKSRAYLFIYLSIICWLGWLRLTEMEEVKTFAVSASMKSRAYLFIYLSIICWLGWLRLTEMEEVMCRVPYYVEIL